MRQTHSQRSCRCFCRSALEPVSALDDYTKRTASVQGINHDSSRGDVPSAIWCASLRQPLHVCVAGRIANYAEDKSLKIFIVQLVPSHRSDRLGGGRTKF